MHYTGPQQKMESQQRQADVERRNGCNGTREWWWRQPVGTLLFPSVSTVPVSPLLSLSASTVRHSPAFSGSVWSSGSALRRCSAWIMTHVTRRQREPVKGRDTPSLGCARQYSAKPTQRNRVTTETCTTRDSMMKDVWKDQKVGTFLFFCFQ